MLTSEQRFLFDRDAACAIRVARRHPDGSFASAGSIEPGLHREIVERLEARVAKLPARRRGWVAWYSAEVSVVASLHGLPDRPVPVTVLDDGVGAT